MDAAIGKAMEMLRHVEPLRMDTPLGGASAGAAAGGFQDIFHQAIQSVHQTQANAADQKTAFLSGESRDLHEVAVAVQKAGLEFEMMLELRNKVVGAYQEIMRMQI